MNVNVSSISAGGKECFRVDPELRTRPDRLRIWEIDGVFKCPIVGACLTFAEQKQLLKKAGLSAKGKSSYEIHGILVGSCEAETPLSRKLQNLLNRKSRKKNAEILEMPVEEFIAYWKRRFASGDYHAALWAAVSRPDLGLDYRKEIFGDIHMAMHLSAEQRAALTTRLSAIQKAEAETRLGLKNAMREKRAVEKVNRQLQVENKLLKARLAAAVTEKETLAGRSAARENERHVPELAPLVSRLEAERAEMSKTLAECNRRISELTAENQRRIEACDHLTAVNDQMRESMYETLKDMRRINDCDECCPSFDLCSKRVLIVGGIERMASLYRQMIEARGGVLDYHDGSMNGGTRQLEDSLRRADIVLCPVNCNSHAACSAVKRLGKKYGKPTHMMANFSLSAISRMIDRNGDGCSVRN
jgi:hypothetical protein